MIALPTEVQLMILTEVYRNTLAFSLYNFQVACDNTITHENQTATSSVDEDLTAQKTVTVRVSGLPPRCTHLSKLFLAARTCAPAPCPTILSDIDCPNLDCKGPIASISNSLALRVALAAALPAWRGALRDIPFLWTCVAVSVDEEMWGPHALEAVQEALDFSRHEPLNIAITRLSAMSDEESDIDSCSESNGESDGERQCRGNLKRNGDGDVFVAKDDPDGGEGERTRVLQVMALLAPHIGRWRWLGINTLYSTSLPIPTIDFAGSAPLLVELDFWAVIPPLASTKGSESGPRETAVLNMPCLEAITMDLPVFCAAFLYAPGMLSGLLFLTLYGQGYSTIQWDGLPVVSVRTLLECLAQIESLCSLLLDGAYLGVGNDGDQRERDKHKGIDNFTASTALVEVQNLYCNRLSAPVLEEVLTLSSYIPEGDPGSLFHVGEIDELEVEACGLPSCPHLDHYKRIKLVRIAAKEDIVSFLAGAQRCEEIHAVECEAFPVDEFSRLTTAVYPGPGDDYITLLKLWLCRRMHVLSVKDCVGVKAERVREVAMARQWARRCGHDIDIMYNVLLDGKKLGPEDPNTASEEDEDDDKDEDEDEDDDDDDDEEDEEEEEKREEPLEADTQGEQGT